jgi:hypothetical protein
MHISHTTPNNVPIRAWAIGFLPKIDGNEMNPNPKAAKASRNERHNQDANLCIF